LRPLGRRMLEVGGLLRVKRLLAGSRRASGSSLCLGGRGNGLDLKNL